MADIFKRKINAAYDEMLLLLKAINDGHDAFALYKENGVLGAEGVQLDLIGQLFNTGRIIDPYKETDADYRKRIRESYIYSSDIGTIDGVLHASRLLTGLVSSNGRQKFREIESAGIEITFLGQTYYIPPGTDSPDPDHPKDADPKLEETNLIVRRIKKFVSAGVTLNILMNPSETTAFKFSEKLDEGNYSPQGFTDPDPDPNGEFPKPLISKGGKFINGYTA